MDYSDFDHDSGKFLKESISSSPLRQLTHLGLLGIKNYGPSSVKLTSRQPTGESKTSPVNHVISRTLHA